MLQDPMSLLTAYMQGSRFAQENIDRAEKRQEEANKRTVDEGMGVLLSHTTRVNPETGQVELRPESEVWSDPQFLRDFSSTDLGQKVLRNGLPAEDQDRIAKVVPVRATQISNHQNGAPEYGIEVKWLDKDGTEISRGPIAVDGNGQRSSANDAMVVPIKTSDVFHTTLAEAYKYNPEAATQYKNTLVNASKQALVKQWMENPDQRNVIRSQFAMAGGDPADFDQLEKSGIALQPTKVTAPTGIVTTTDPRTGTTSIGYDPEATKVGLRSYEDQASSKAVVDNNIENQLLGDRIKRANTTYEQTAPAKVRADRGIAAEDAQMYERGKSLLLSSDPREQALGREMIQGVAGNDPVKTDALIQGIQSDATLTKTLKDGFPDMSVDQVTTQVADNYPRMSQDDQQRFVKGLLPGIKNKDPKAIAALEATTFPQGLGGGKGEAPKPAEFKPGVTKDLVKAIGGSSELANSIGVDGEIKFREINSALQRRGVNVEKGSVEEAMLQRVVAYDAALTERGNLSDIGVEDSAPALWTWENLPKDIKTRWGRGEGDALPAAESFVRDVYMNLGNQRKAAGLPTDMASMNGVARDVMELSRAGLPTEKAIDLSMKLEKMPENERTVLGLQIRNYARANGKNEWAVAADWFKRGITSKAQAEQMEKQNAVRGLGRTGSALHPEMYSR